MGLPFLTRLRVGRDRDDGVVDRSEAADEAAVGDAQPDLRLGPWLVGGLSAQHLAHRVADRQQRAHDLRVAGKDTAAALALLDCDGVRFAVHDLHQPAGLAEQVGAFLDRGAICRGARARDRPGFVVTVIVRLGVLADAVKMPAGNRSSASVSKISSAMPFLRGRQV